jgi:DNA-binding NarL/FixJ family response regulator
MLLHLALNEIDFLIIRGLADGDTSKEIAQKTGRSSHTVDSRVNGLRKRFEARSRAQLVARWYEVGLLERHPPHRLHRA